MRFDPTDSLGYLIRQAARTMRNRVQMNIQAEGLDMTMEKGGVLMLLWHEDGQSQHELARKLGKDKTTLARLLDGMEKALLVVRVPDKTDKRIKLIYLTQKGKEIREHFRRAIIKTIEEATVGVPKHDIEKCKSVLKIIFENLGPFGELDGAC